MKNRWVRFVTLALLAAGPTLAGVPAKTSSKFAATTYREQVGRITVLVDGFHASLHAHDPYIPVPVAIGLERRGLTISLTPESFTLIDQEGNSYPAATHSEVQRRYTKREFDAALLGVWPLVLGQQFAISREQPARFFPSPQGRTRIPRVELAPFTWCRDVLYFPRPEAGLGGVLTLRVAGGGIPDPIDVRFQIPWRQKSSR